MILNEHIPIFESCSSGFLTTFYFYYHRNIAPLKKNQHRKAQKGVPDRMIFVKNLEKISNLILKIVEFLNKAVEVTIEPSD